MQSRGAEPTYADALHQATQRGKELTQQTAMASQPDGSLAAVLPAQATYDVDFGSDSDVDL